MNATPASTFPANSSARPSIWLTLAAMVAFAALGFTSASPLPGVLLFALLWTHATPQRWPRDASLVWGVRLAAFAFIALQGSVSGLGADLLFDAKTFNTLGLICAAELVLQAWRQPPRGARFQPSMLLMSGVVLLAACNTYDNRYIRFCVPLWMAFSILALREFNVFPASTLKPSPLDFPSRRSLGKVLPLLAIAIGLGGFFQWSIEAHRAQLMMIGARFLLEHAGPQSGGVSSQPNLGSSFEVPDSPQRVLLIEGNAREEHWRAMAFDTYSGGRWFPSLESRRKDDFPEPIAQVPGENAAVKVTRLTQSGGIVFAPLHAAAIIAPPGSALEWDAINAGPLQCADPPPFDYQIVPGTQQEMGMTVQQGPLCAPLENAQRGRYLQLPPEIDPRVKTLAARITRDDWLPAQRVESVVEYLLTNHRYSRTTRRGGSDPVSRFLLEKKAAHCEYFASAAVILLRCANVPARYVTGFYAHEANGPNRIVIRQRDAHAWAECWIDGVGWITVDATPASGRPDEAAPPVPLTTRLREWLQDHFVALRRQISQMSRGQMLLVLTGVLVLWLFERWRLNRRASAALEMARYNVPHREFSVLAQRFEQMLSRCGIECAADRTWRDALATQPPQSTCKYFEADLQQFIHDYNAARFGGRDAAENRRALQQMLDELEQKIKRQKVVSHGDDNDTKQQ